MVRERIVIIVLLIFIICLYIVKITTGIFIDGFDDQDYTLQEEIKTLDTQNLLLQDKVLTFESYTKIASEAAKMGYYSKPR